MKLDLSKLEAGAVVLETVSFNLQTIVGKRNSILLHESFNALSEDVLDIMAPLAHAKGLRMCSRFDSNIYQRVIGDPLRIRQVILNLYSNSIKFTPAGSVIISTSLIDTVISKDSSTILVRFEIVDTGK